MKSLMECLRISVLACMTIGVCTGSLNAQQQQPKVKLEELTEWLKTPEAAEYGNERRLRKKAELRGKISDLKKRITELNKPADTRLFGMPKAKENEKDLNEKIELVLKEIETLSQIKQPLYIPIIEAGKALRFSVGCVGRWSSHNRKDQFLVAPVNYVSESSCIGICFMRERHESLIELEPKKIPSNDEKLLADWETLARKSGFKKELDELRKNNPEGFQDNILRFRVIGVDSPKDKSRYLENVSHMHYFDKPTYVTVEEAKSTVETHGKPLYELNIKIIDLTEVIKATGALE